MATLTMKKSSVAMKTPVRTTGIVAQWDVTVGSVCPATPAPLTATTVSGAAAVSLEDPCTQIGVDSKRVLSMVDVAARPEFAIRAVTCHADHAWWSPPEIRGDYMLVLVRRGRFRRRAAGFTAEVDPTLAYLGI